MFDATLEVRIHTETINENFYEVNYEKKKMASIFRPTKLDIYDVFRQSSESTCK